MPFEIRMGVPEMAAFNDDLTRKAREGGLDKEQTPLFKKWRKALEHLSRNPRHPGLASHGIEALSRKYGRKIWQSYLDQGDTADPVFWTYGPGRGAITVLGIEPHPEDRKRGAHERVKLSAMPETP